MYNNVVEFTNLTRTAKEAADSLGCSVAQIAKSLIFIDDNDLPVLVVASGSNRVNEKKFGLQKADADYVKDKTGFVIGGVPPWGHKDKIRTIIDMDLANYEGIWASAGKTNSVFKLTFEELVRETGGKVLAIK